MRELRKCFKSVLDRPPRVVSAGSDHPQDYALMGHEPNAYVEETPSGVFAIPAADISAALFVGWARRGPIDHAKRVTSFADFEKAYGGLEFDSWLGHAVSHFFANGGSEARVLRITSGVEPASSASASLDGFRLTATSRGSWGNRIRIDASGSETERRWDIVVRDKPDSRERLAETWTNLSADSSSPTWPGTALDQSDYIRATADGSSSGPPTVVLSGGSDGALIGPGDVDFQTAVIDAFGPGGAASQEDRFGLLCVPGLSDPATLGLLQVIARQRLAFLVADCPQSASAATVAAEMPRGTGADFSACYFPWVVATDPLSRGERTLPPSGFICGVYARTDARRGVWQAPAGLDAEMVGAQRLSAAVSDSECGALNATAINCLKEIPFGGRVVWGARTLAGADGSGSDWKYVPVRRLALMIERSISEGLHWTVFEPNDEQLWSRLRLSIGSFMQSLFRQGAFQGQSPRDAYFVKCDRDTNSAATIAEGIVTMLVGFAPIKPAEFVTLTIVRPTGPALP